jgi:hypothetical protein
MPLTEAGGPLLSPESITGGEHKMIGSVFFIQAETIEGVRKVVEEDVYYTSGVVSHPPFGRIPRAEVQTLFSGIRRRL